jgi:hypothetical protein
LTKVMYLYGRIKGTHFTDDVTKCHVSYKLGKWCIFEQW